MVEAYLPLSYFSVSQQQHLWQLALRLCIFGSLESEIEPIHSFIVSLTENRMWSSYSHIHPSIHL